jgi:hypothetical protein
MLFCALPLAHDLVMAPDPLRKGLHCSAGKLRPLLWRRRFLAESAHRPSSRPRHSGRGGGGEIYKSGEMVRETGIYEVIHDRAHRAAHEVVMLAGDAFPPCETCELRVRFRLVRTAPYIFQDEDFENPEE